MDGNSKKNSSMLWKILTPITFSVLAILITIFIAPKGIATMLLVVALLAQVIVLNVAINTILKPLQKIDNELEEIITDIN